MELDGYSIAPQPQLVRAVLHGDLAQLRQLLSQQHQDGNYAFTDFAIDEALCEASKRGCVESCRVLLNGINARLKEQYKAAWNDSWTCPLHAAAKFGHLPVVRLFQEHDFFNINQIAGGITGRAPLSYAAMADTNSLETSRFLLANGADPNGCEEYNRPLWYAVFEDNTEVVRLLLQHGADPNLNRRWQPQSTDHAIKNGNAEILSMLLQHGAFVGHSYDVGGTSLNTLFSDGRITRETKLNICRLLLEHAARDTSSHTTAFLQSSLKKEIQGTNNQNYEILLEAGMDPNRRRALYLAIQAGKEPVCRLLVQYGADPFVEDKEEKGEGAVTPFHAAARAIDTAILRFFLELWDARFSASGGRNDDGHFPMHVLCRDPHVSLQAIKLLVEEFQANISMAAASNGRFPFHSVALSDAKLDVVYYLLNHWPDALAQRLPATDEITNVTYKSTTAEDDRHHDPLPASNKGDSGGACDDDDDDVKPHGRKCLNVSSPLKKKAKTTH